MREPAVTGALLAVWALAAPGTASGVEEPKFRVIVADGDFEIREYAPVIVAETIVEGDWGVAGNAGFRRLASYIFGANDGGRRIAMTVPVSQQAPGSRIAMTAPVAQERRGTAWAVAFTMPREYSLDRLPVPNDPTVHLRPIGERRVGAIRFSGRWNAERFEAGEAELRRWLTSKGEKVIGEPVSARYNPPWTPWFLRRNEILLELAPRPE
ncbi:MAG TPA: heme-binding protein [Thermoanaerobaculia bacterium]|nr:heme-binding protein [Thermoanaerobaculia bacterium]